MLVCFTLGSLQEECLHKWIKTDHFCVGDGVAWVLECSRSASALGIMLIDEQPLHCEAEVKGLRQAVGAIVRALRDFTSLQRLVRLPDAELVLPRPLAWCVLQPLHTPSCSHVLRDLYMEGTPLPVQLTVPYCSHGSQRECTMSQ